MSTTEDLRRALEANGCQARQAPTPPDPGEFERVGRDPASIEISIVVCTHNRSRQLAELLHALAVQAEGAPVEILVVDSASAPGHAEAVRAKVEACARARLVRLDEKGLSLARNTGVGHARGAWVGFIDDDETPSPDWVEAACALARRLPENCAACGGVVEPRVDGRPLPPIGARWRAYLGEFNQRGEFDQTANPHFGAGHSLMRVAAIKQVGGFYLRLGRTGNSLLSGEEVLLLRQLTTAGWRIWHSDRISVQHEVEAERLERGWARRRAYWEGRSTARILQIVDPNEMLRKLGAAALKSVPLAPSAAVSPFGREVDLRLALNIGLVSECVRLLIGSRARRSNPKGEVRLDQV